jgi:hypothetical protein
MSLPFRQATTSSPLGHSRLSAEPSRQDKRSSPSRFGGFFGGLLRQASDPPPPPPLERRTTFRLQDYLPQALEDRAITETVDAIQEHLEGHVNHFYHFKMMPSVAASRPLETSEPPLRQGELSSQFAGNAPPVQPPIASRSFLDAGFSNSIQSIAQVAAPADEQRQRAKVHSLIADRLIKAIQPAKAGEHAVFLPDELSGLLSALPLPESMEDDQVFTSALSQWRVLSCYLLYHKKVRKANEKDFQERLGEEVERVLKSLDKDLQPFIDESRDEKRREHLRSLMEMTADLGRLITSQAAVYEFSWSYRPEDGRDSQREIAEQRGSRSSRESHHAVVRQKRSRSSRETMAVFPALMKTTDHYGIRLTKPVCVCDPQMERLRLRLSRTRTEEMD